MITIAICDDEKIYVDYLQKEAKRILDSIGIEHTIMTFSQPVDFITAQRISPFHLVFLDIMMPMLNGFDISKEIRSNYHETMIVYVSSNSKLVFDSIAYHPFAFIRKGNINQLKTELSQTIEHYFQYYSLFRSISVNDINLGISYIKLHNLIYVKSEKHYVNFHTETDICNERGTLEEAIARIDSEAFIRVHQRYSVNVHHIRRFFETSAEIELSNGERIPVSRGMRENAYRQYLIAKRVF